MQLCSLGQGAVSPWSIVPRCPRVLLVLPTMSDSSQASQLSQSQLSDIVGSTCSTLGQRGTSLHGTLSLVPRNKVSSSGPTFIVQKYSYVSHAYVEVKSLSEIYNRLWLDVFYYLKVYPIYDIKKVNHNNELHFWV